MACTCVCTHMLKQAGRQCNVMGRKEEKEIHGETPFHSQHNDVFICFSSPDTLEYLTSSARMLGSEWLQEWQDWNSESDLRLPPASASEAPCMPTCFLYGSCSPVLPTQPPQLSFFYSLDYSRLASWQQNRKRIHRRLGLDDSKVRKLLASLMGEEEGLNSCMHVCICS